MRTLHARVAYSPIRLHWRAIVRGAVLPLRILRHLKCGPLGAASRATGGDAARNIARVATWPCGVAHCGDATGWNKQPFFPGMI